MREWIISTAKFEGYRVGELIITFCSDPELHKINLEYLHHDTFTDIITFDYFTDGYISGEIYISLDRIKENATKFKKSLDNELLRIIIHGVLHLLGYEDKTHDQKNVMDSKEDYYLSLLNK